MIISIDKARIVLALAAIVMVIVITLKLLTGYWENRSEPALTGDMTTLEAVPESRPVDISREEGAGFLSEYRLERDRVRSREITLLREIASDTTSTARAREEAYAKLVQLADREEKEMHAEALIKAQGFADCAVIMSPTATMVMISGNLAYTVDQDRIRRSVSVATGFTEKSVSVLQLVPNE